MAQHKWHDAIIAWAKGETVQETNRVFHKERWTTVKYPDWGDDNLIFRVKPVEPNYGKIFRDAYFHAEANQNAWDVGARAVIDSFCQK